MIPVSFAPMILKLVFPKLEKKMDELKLDIIEHIFKVGKIKESIAYREQPNDADIKIKSLEEQNKLLASEVGILENRLNKLEILNTKTKKLSNG